MGPYLIGVQERSGYGYCGYFIVRCRNMAHSDLHTLMFSGLDDERFGKACKIWRQS